MRTLVTDLDERLPVPQKARNAVLVGMQRFGEATSVRRRLPDFLIIGAQKAGTSALFHYLSQHPQVRPSIMKEVHYFDLNLDRGERWYRAHFPRRTGASRSGGFLTGEATPYYLFHPLVPERVAATVPDAKLIVLLRDPVRRAISHYYHEVVLGFEPRSLDRALVDEQAMMAVEQVRIEAGLPPSPAHQHGSYFSRGLYAEQLRRWLSWFDATQILVLGTEQLSTDNGSTYHRVLEFLGVRDDRRDSFEPVYQRSYPQPDPELIQQLRKRYIGPNDALMELLGRDRVAEFPWASET